MSYEYLKGLGAADTLGPSDRGVSSRGGTPPPASPPAGSPGGTRYSITDKDLIFGGTKQGATPAQPATPPVIVFKAFAIGEPAVPAGSVKTLPAERAELKEYCRLLLGTTGTGAVSSFYAEKLRTDPNFTYMNANTLAAYRNAVAVVVDRLRGTSDTSLTVADIGAVKAWWERCHKSTWIIFKLRTTGNTTWRKDAMWVPVRLAMAYKATYKATNTCPVGTA